MIDILLATYNGGKYLPKQLDSSFNQKLQDFTLLIHDDGSTDNTVNMLLRYKEKFPNKKNIEKNGLKVSKNVKLVYRSNGWHGKTVIQNKEKKKIDYRIS